MNSRILFYDNTEQREKQRDWNLIIWNDDDNIRELIELNYSVDSSTIVSIENDRNDRTRVLTKRRVDWVEVFLRFKYDRIDWTPS